jgi:hypothetical protein
VKYVLLAFWTIAVVIFVAVIAAGMTGCAAPSAFYVDANFTDSERAELQSAADEWSRATSGLATIDFIWNYRVNDGMNDTRRVIVRGSTGNELAHHRRLVALGIVTAERIDFNMVSMANMGVSLRDAALHELGHSAGAQHVAEVHSTMYAYEGVISATRQLVPPHCITWSDLVSFCDANDCNSTRLAPCD